ncbi:MAG TPA: hypothetical protein DEP32_13930 [Pseudomonas sp.]|nr:hypothetical protein [Pseudomonas sp.]MBB50253.1 hypothetical protein [Pseudomonadales bacterium]MBB50499.1 hypothetical protein [Pseudomonadales bacterium]HCA25259.1 hypothetical protein [Pseudomonas sp.]|tara:strand:- start:2428 stop:2622 length:195 start_codon:yes stop_codon:yes gene_type:complete
MRIDRAVSRALCVQLNSQSRAAQFEIADFSPYEDSGPAPVASDAPVASVEDVFGLLSRLASKGD